MQRHPGVAQQLELEVLETAALEDVVKTSRVIDECKTLGVHFSLDDVQIPVDERAAAIVVLSEALDRLEKLDPQ